MKDSPSHLTPMHEAFFELSDGGAQALLDLVEGGHLNPEETEAGDHSFEIIETLVRVEQMKRLIRMEDAEAQLAQEIIDRRKLLTLYTEEQSKEQVRCEITARLNRLKKLRTQRRCDSCGKPFLHPYDMYVIQSEPGYKIECYDCISQSEVQTGAPQRACSGMAFLHSGM